MGLELGNQFENLADMAQLVTNKSDHSQQALNGKILVIDDDISVAVFVQTILNREGYTVEYITDASHAEEAIASLNPDMIICDVKMPNLTGYQLLRKLRADDQYSTIPFVFLSCLNRENEIDHGYSLGADEFLTKPIDPVQLRSTVGTVFRLLRRGGRRSDPKGSGDDSGSFKGEIATLGITQVVQLLANEHKSGTLSLLTPDGEGEVGLLEGGFACATFEGDERTIHGVDAFHRILSLETGQFSFDPHGDVPDVPDPQPVDRLIINWLVAQDHDAAGLDVDG